VVQKRGTTFYEHVQQDVPIEQSIVGQSSLIRQIRQVVQQVARHPHATVLLQGESGTGKEVVAHAIHLLSPRVSRNFVDINCAALPEMLIETELFGVESGAFTDAKTSREGHILRADGGTLFLDEIGEMPLTMQAKLLRFLETHRFRRVGGMREIHVDVRLISATNVDLQRAILKRAFREDLYYRLNVVTITLPPLRERLEDIPLLVEHYLHKHVEETGEQDVQVSPKAMELLTRYEWPGNVRELFAVLQSGMILCDGNVVMPQDLPLHIQTYRQDATKRLLALSQQFHLPPEGLDLRAFLDNIEQQFMREALTRCHGNQMQAAALLRLSRDQLRYRLPKV
jgi:two-component system response regulator AtoC